MDSARSGVIVDKETLDLFAHVSDALKGLASAVEQVEARLCLVEKLYDGKLIKEAMKDLGLE